MNFEKFKDIDMPDIKVNPDFKYLEKLNELPKQKRIGKVLSVMGTVAAAVLIVLAVGLWAIIGRGVQMGMPSATTPSKTEIESINIILTDVTEWYEERSDKNLKDYLSNHNESIPKPTYANPKTKDFEFLGKKYSLSLKEEINQQHSWMLYRYTDGNETAFVFNENGELTEYEYLGEPVTTATVTKQEAEKIAKDFAGQMFAEQFDDYVFYESSDIGQSGPTEKYSFSFTKRYGKDKSLNGEYCLVFVRVDGKVLKCSIRNLYEFKKHDLSIFNGITHADIEKAAMSAFEKYDGYTYEIESSSINFIDGKNIISVSIKETSAQGTSALFLRYFELSTE